LIDILIRDLGNVNREFEERMEIERGFDPYAMAKWSPSDTDVSELKSYVEDELKHTNLPREVKDLVADGSYGHLEKCGVFVSLGV